MDDIKIKVSALWVVHILSWIVGDLLRISQPGFIKGEVTGESGITNEILLVGAIIYTFQFTMILLSLTLDEKLNRRSNFGVAVVILLLDIIHLITSIVDNEPGWEIFLGLVYPVFIISIMWYAWKWSTKNLRYLNNVIERT